MSVSKRTLEPEPADEPFWVGDPSGGETFAAFRCEFSVESSMTATVRSTASGPYRVFIDGELFAEGPVRARRGILALASHEAALSPGAHTIAVLVHHEGVDTRIVGRMPAHLVCALDVGPSGGDDRAHGERSDAPGDGGNRSRHARIDALASARSTRPLPWRATPLSAYRTGVRRINPELGWIDWCDTRELPDGWTKTGFDDSAWSRVETVALPGWQHLDAGIGPVATVDWSPRPVGRGYLSERYGYELDDPPARFFLRRLTAERIAGERDEDPSQGFWLRYDAGRIGLYSPVVELDLPAGAIVEIAYCEELVNGRVTPFVTLSLGPTCNMDHFVARGGRQRIEVSGYRGGRYLELHVLYPDPSSVPGDLAQEAGVHMDLRWRTYYPVRSGSFHSNDRLLNRIWVAGADTLAACSEDAVDDCPTRERGQWLGDVVTVGAAIAGASFADLRLFRKALIDAALSARDDGMVAGLCPGTVEHIPSYAATWTEGVLTYLDLTGDWNILELLYGAMARNVDALASYLGPEGMRDRNDAAHPLGWVFVDWGYVPNDGPADMVLTMHLLNALRSGRRWHQLLVSARETGRVGGPGRQADASIPEHLPVLDPDPSIEARFERAEEQVVQVLRAFLARCFSPELDWELLGYHRAVLAIRHGLLTPEERLTALREIRAHQDRCFPNDARAPRNDAPFKREPRLITPYFYNYAMPLFAEAGAFDYVLDQYRSCWGWLLEGGYTTLCEVFDRRWSQCHQWSGAPTWQLSHYVLGITPELSWGDSVYRFTGVEHELEASGSLPVAGTNEVIALESRVRNGTFELALETPRRITILPGHAPTAGLLRNPGSVLAAVPEALALEPGRHELRVDLATGVMNLQPH